MKGSPCEFDRRRAGNEYLEFAVVLIAMLVALSVGEAIRGDDPGGRDAGRSQVQAVPRS